MTQQLNNAYQLGQRHKIDPKTVAQVLTKAGVKPAMSAPYGRNVTNWFDAATADATIANWSRAKADKWAAKVAPQTTTAEEGVVDAAIGALRTELKVIANVTGMTDETLHAVSERQAAYHEQMVAQNRALLDAIVKVGAKLDAVLRELGVQVVA